MYVGQKEPRHISLVIYEDRSAQVTPPVLWPMVKVSLWLVSACSVLHLLTHSILMVPWQRVKQSTINQQVLPWPPFSISLAKYWRYPLCDGVTLSHIGWDSCAQIPLSDELTGFRSTVRKSSPPRMLLSNSFEPPGYSL